LLIASEAPLDELLPAVAASLPPAFQFPDHTTCALRVGERVYATPGHAPTRWMLGRELVTSDGERGVIEVAYHGPWSEAGDAAGPFLVEEEELLASLADMLRSALDRHRATETARIAGERLDLALRAAGMGVWERDLPTDRVCWTPHMARLIGHEGELRGQHGDFEDMVHPDDQREVYAFIAGMEPGKPHTIEFRLRRPDGGWRPVAASGLVVLDGDGKPARNIGVVMDISERRALEARLRQAQKLEVLGQVAGSVAHDFANFLAVVALNVDLLKESHHDAASRELLDDIEHAASGATALTRQLLAFGRRTELKPEVVVQRAVSGRLLPLLRRLAGAAVEIVLREAGRECMVWADASQLGQLVMNLVVNARDAMGAEGGTLTIASAIGRGADGAAEVVLTVEDTGPGVPPDVCEHIFEPFYTTKDPGTGTGLGLAVVRAVARQWGGDVAVESPPGGGARFRVHLPLHPAPAA
jgi:PAS domain S-box-containing protein